jgi:hypothetical protein
VHLLEHPLPIRPIHTDGSRYGIHKCRPYGTHSVYASIPGTDMPGCPMPLLRGWERVACLPPISAASDLSEETSHLALETKSQEPTAVFPKD